MVKRTILAGSLMVAMLPAAAFASGVNQGDPSKVLTVDNTYVSCDDPTPSDKVEGGLGRWIAGGSADLIDKVTVKSGEGAEATEQTTVSDNSFFIKLTKDVSNYVVWTCPFDQDEYPDL